MIFKFFLAVVLFALGALAVYFLARTATLDCRRDRSNQVSATIIRQGIGFQEQERIPGGELLRAEVDAMYSSDEDGSSTTYRLRLVTMRYSTFLTQMHSSGYGGVAEKADRLNHFLHQSTQRTISITQDDRIVGFCIGGILWVAGFTVLAGRN